MGRAAFIKINTFFSKKTIDRKYKWIYNPDIVKKSTNFGLRSRKATGYKDPAQSKRRKKW